MMGETGSLPLPSTTQPSAMPLAVQAGASADAAAATDAPADAGLLFDLLLGNPQETVAVATVALPVGRTKTSAIERAEEAPVDPLMAVLAQMPQLQPAPAAVPPAGASAPSASPLSIAMQTAQPISVIPLPPADGTAAAPVAASGAPSVALAAPAPVAARTGAWPSAFVLPQAETDATTAALAGNAIAPSTVAALASDAAPASADIAGVPLTAPLHAAMQVAASTPGPQVAVPPPVLQQPADPAAGYDDRFSSHVTWLAGQRIGQADIRVVPEHLGTIDIRLQMDGNDVRAEFHSNQPEVRQALEASLPRLREMLGQQGLQLAHAGVGQGQNQASGQRQQGDGATAGQTGEPLAPLDAESPLPPDFRRARGLLDVYA